MVATLQSRKEALEAKIQEKNEELKKLCLQEADLTGVIPPEIPLEPGELPPPIRRRIGTSFSFPQNLINSLKDADDESLTALELECKVQTNIAEAALTLANDTTANKAVRRKHRLMYRQSQRRLMELETRLNLLRQGKAQQGKPQQIKKKPRPNTTAIENLDYFWNNQKTHDGNHGSINNASSWPNKLGSGYSTEDIDHRDFSHHSDAFGSLHRSLKSSGTSQSSNSSRADAETEEHKLTSNQSYTSNNFMLASSFSHPNIQDVAISKSNSSPKNSGSHRKKSPKRGNVRRQWDTQSAGGTLLPNQTYPDHSHQPNLSRTQSLGNMETNSLHKDNWSSQNFSTESNQPKEKEWYETALDSAPSPPLRTSSKLPSAARMLYHMQEMQSANSWNITGIPTIQGNNSHPALTRKHNVIHRSLARGSSVYPIPDNATLQNDNLSASLQQMHINPNLKSRSASMYVDENGCLSQKDYSYEYGLSDNRSFFDYSNNIPRHMNEMINYQMEQKAKIEQSQMNESNDQRFENRNLARQNSVNLIKYKNNNKMDELDGVINKQDVVPENNNYRNSESVYINIPEDNIDIGKNNNWMNEVDFNTQKNNNQYELQNYDHSVKSNHPSSEVITAPKSTPTQPYFHMMKTPYQQLPIEKIETLQYQAARNRHTASEDLQNFQTPSPVHVGVHHPPHAITQNEITFDTVVPFESPQNHTVVQAGKWQPYREVTKPFEMSDFYKYSTKFRQNKSSNVGSRAMTPDISRSSPNTQHQKGVYTPLRPMTCQPIESKSNPLLLPNHLETQYDEEVKQLVEVSLPEIV